MYTLYSYTYDAYSNIAEGKQLKFLTFSLFSNFLFFFGETNCSTFFIGIIVGL